jgi:hypothetical protein
MSAKNGFGLRFVSIRSRSSGRVLDVPGFATDDSVKIQQYGENRGPNQCWILQPTGGEFVKIVSAYSLKVLDVPGSATDDHVLVQQYSDNGGNNQQWKLEPTTQGFFKIRCRSSGKVLDVPGSAADDGVQIQQYTDNGGKNQEWRLEPVASKTKEFHITLESFEIIKTRARHNDTDFVSCTLAAGKGAPQTKTKAMGDVNDGKHLVGLSFGPVTVAHNEAVIFNYLIINSGHQDQQAIQAALTKGATKLADEGAKEAAEAISVGAASLVGASIGSFVAPVIGTALGALTGWLVDEISGFFFANCDGLVAAEQVAVTGAQLAALAAPHRVTTFHAGTDSAAGCGGNSKYKATWQITAIG